jgi:hypothetical protein
MIAVSTVGWIVRGVLGLIAAVTIYVMGAGMLRKFKVVPEAEPDPDLVIEVNERFRCTICGAEVVMTAAQGEREIEAPRHCREDMVPV